jgi:hypothetical protein
MQVHETPDGGLIVAGSTFSSASGSCDAWALKLAQDGTLNFNPSSGFRTTDTAVAGRGTTRFVTPTAARVIAAELDTTDHHPPGRKTSEPVTPLAP